MFSVKQKREIADKVQEILRATNHPELPPGEIQFTLHVDGAESWSDIKNNDAVINPSANPWNEKMTKSNQFEARVIEILVERGLLSYGTEKG